MKTTTKNGITTARETGVRAIQVQDGIRSDTGRAHPHSMLQHEKFLPLHVLAMRLGIPAAWLKSEADAGRIPSLQAGRRRLFDLEAVRETLLARSVSEGAAHGQ